MATPKKTRLERHLELAALLNSPRQHEVERMFLACFPAGTCPPVGSLMIQTIADHEFGPEDYTPPDSAK